jgi:(1->4)-alpha-D-glucan 1-alpha-D-glucosylmutase
MPPAVPLATYRLQLRKDFGFDEAAALVPYLKSLGITHLYASPFLKARAGSQHGYDIVDHASLNPEFGGDEAFERLSTALKEADLGLILDFVPNHMGVGHADNAWWLDVLEWGQKSPHAAAFDISWDLLPFRRSGGVLIPVLGRPYGEALQNGEIALKYDAAEGSFSAWYFSHRFPINPPRYAEILKTVATAAGADDEPAGHAILELAAQHASPHSPSYTQAPEFKRRLSEIPGAARVIEQGVVAYRGDSEAGVTALHRLLERQHYRLAYWRVAVSAINYRRFFDINDLAGLRIEDPHTFRSVHTLVARLVADGRLHGLRIDHIDGLRNPMQYTRRLAQLLRQVRGSSRGPSFYVVIEKILAEGEAVPRFTGVSGTTGYEWLNFIVRTLVDDRGLDRLDGLWRDFTAERRPFSEILEQSKLRVLDTMLASEFTVLTQLLARIAAGHYSTRDFTLDRLRAALELYVLEFPIYRTYIAPGRTSEEDRATIDRTTARARRRWHGPDPEIFDFLRAALTLDLVHDKRAYSRTRVQNFALKFQQFTGPMMAKSLEDTAFYRHHRLLALNEVGGDPTASGLSAPEFHARLAARAAQSSDALTATATHDTKRGEDARARILALAELPDEWGAAISEWRRLNAGHDVSAGHEYMLYQALLGAWPLAGPDEDFAARMQGYAIKAAREGKNETSWTDPDETYENGLRAFVTKVLNPQGSAEFLRLFQDFARRIALIGALNSLSQLVLKCTMPGVPDFYQGTELWDLSLVDPDNRRPVGFALRAAALAEGRAGWDWRDLAANWTNGRIKLAVTERLLALRQALPEVFAEGDYQPVEVHGEQRDHVLAFVRSHGRRQRVLVVVGRHFAAVTDRGRRWPVGWWPAELVVNTGQSTGWRDALGAMRNQGPHKLTISELFETLPVAVLRST